MKYDVLHNFISPVTGRILVDTDYVIVGDDNGVGVPSPILIDLELDLINLRANYNILRQASFVIGYPNDQLPNAQVLNSLDDGYMYNTEGVVSTNVRIPITALPNLTENHLWRGDSENNPVEVAHIAVNNLPNLTYNRVWVGNIISRPVESNFSIAPDNATYVIRTPSLSLPNAQVLNELGTGMAKISFGGYIAIATSGVDYVTPAELEEAIGVVEEEIASGLQGDCDPDTETIKIQKGLKHKSRTHTLLHEMLHAVLFRTGVFQGLDEKMIEVIVDSCATAILENFRLVKIKK